MVNTNNNSVRTWWMVCLTRASVSKTSNTWPTGEVKTTDLFNNYTSSCVGSSFRRFRFNRELQRLLSLPVTGSDGVVVLPSLDNGRTAFDSSRNWGTAPECFRPKRTLRRTRDRHVDTVRNWWVGVLQSGSLGQNLSWGTVNKTDLYQSYTQHLERHARQPTFWRVLHTLVPRTNETSHTLTLASLEECRNVQHNLLERDTQKRQMVFNTATATTA